MKHFSVAKAQPVCSDACERNKQAIAEALRDTLADVLRVLEVGSGSGQHVVHFAREFPAVEWQPADQAEYLPALQARLDTEAPANVHAAVELDVRMTAWAVPECDGIFSANTLHYMSRDCVSAFFAGVGRTLAPGGALVVYGPFNYGGRYTSASNARFDEWLRQSDPLRAIRDFEWVNELATAQQLALAADISMPANNRTLVWRRKTAV